MPRISDRGTPLAMAADVDAEGLIHRRIYQEVLDPVGQPMRCYWIVWVNV